ncbi:hypothetical protein AXG93_399s1270 [Marchantia polymorpha subsp. ruderalis]|uniref:FLZ-type domain-containing protein n=1 Tax=Marchantia polymorpha subsp. ruderalis TaxID=1480154 RepID=A0A176WI77_MARPO|nr:hypothetical protein AXG93_399s1270 [Marchantia polymorpha subsp. ruderalis]
MPGKRPRHTMRRIASVSNIKSGSMTTGDCSPLPEQPKEKQKSANIGSAIACPAPTASPPRQQVKSPTGSTGSPRSGLGDLLASSRPWERRDAEGVGLGIVAALGSAAQEDCGANAAPAAANNLNLTPASISKGRADFPPVPAYSRKDIISTSSSTSSHAHSQAQAQAHALAHGLRGVGPSARVSHGAPVAMLAAWSQQADMDVEAVTPVAPAPLVPRQRHHHHHHHQQQLQLQLQPQPQPRQPSFLPTLSAGLNFLDACFCCKRRLGEGRDIYIYMGDRAFCSPECRHQQIVMDEQQPEGCSQAAMRIGGADASRHSSQRNRVVGAGTAAAA